MNQQIKPRKNFFLRKRMRLALWAVFFLAALAATAFACAWPGTSHSVRFNDYQSEPEMERLPPLPTLAEGTNRLRAYWDFVDSAEYVPDSYPEDQPSEEELDDLWDDAREAEEEGTFTRERELLNKYLDATKVARHLWLDPVDRQARRNSAIDRVDAISALDHGSSSARLKTYLQARALITDDKADEANDVLNRVGSDPNLNDNVAYLKGVVLYIQEEFEKAADAFNNVARKYPGSEKREAALFMAALATMKSSSAYSPTSGDEAHLHEERHNAVHPVEIDEAWHQAMAGFKRVTAEYPRGRYYNDARGWIAYLWLRKEDRAAALVEYYRLLADSRDKNAQLEAAVSLEMVRHHATADQMSRVEREIADEPQVALTYAYHNIFNYSIDPGPATAPYDPNASESANDEQDRVWQENRASAKRATLERILSFSLRLVEHYPNLSLGGNFALRAAQASQELDKNADALQFANRALQSGVSGDERAQALWSSGLAEHRLKQFGAAKRTFATLLKEYPKSEMVEGARRILAMISEDEGNINGALEQYIALDYGLDVAYFIDVLMTPEQLAGFIQQHSGSPEANEFTYALGLRYLRANRWDDARATFSRVKAVGSPDFNMYGSRRCYGYITDDECSAAKTPEYDSEDNVILTYRLLMGDVQTANDLEALEKAVNQATGDEAKAEALYQLASYQYEASSLLFYNPIAWGGNGGRYWSLSQFAGNGGYRAPNESQLLFAYMQEHDTFARALKIYLEVVNKYPQTRAARDALYTAAVCHERLSGYNQYWRDLYGHKLHAGSRMVTYADVRVTYPKYQLPKGTYGWEPSTRTVNGGPGFAARPKYVPPPTRMARVKMLIESLWGGVWMVWTGLWLFWVEKGRHWLTLLVLLIAIRIAWRLALQNRRLLRPKLTRLRLGAEKPVVGPAWTTVFSRAQIEFGWREQAQQFLLQRRDEFFELARDRVTRPLLLRNIASHSFLAWLVVNFLWLLHFG